MSHLLSAMVGLLALVVALSCSAAGVERFESGSLAQRWTDASKQNSTKEAWLGWSIDRWADPNGYSYAGGWNFGGSRFALKGRPLSGLLTAEDSQAAAFSGPPPYAGWERRPIAILLRISPDGVVTRVINSDFQVPINLRGKPLNWLGRHNPEDSITLLVRLLAGGSGQARPRVRESLIRAIARHSHPSAFEVLEGFVQTLEDPELREAATEGLSWQDDPRALPVLLRLIDEDSAWKVRRAAVEALGELPEAEGLPALAKIAHTHNDRDLGEEAIETLGSLGRRQPRAREALFRLLTLHES
ncbi:MAG: HEAT repeat domain-containing protein [Pseudomonadota bacterium]